MRCDYRPNEKGVGDLPERWDVAPDGKCITFALRKGVKFHDGADFTCADAKYSLGKLADPKRALSTFAAVMGAVLDKATCPEPSTLVLDLKKPSAAIFTILAGAHSVIRKDGIAERVDRKDPKFLVGTGPFKYKSHTGPFSCRLSGMPALEARASRPLRKRPGEPRSQANMARSWRRPDNCMTLGQAHS